MPRPICVHCGARYGRRFTDAMPVTWPAGTPMPAYRGNGIVLSETTVCNQKSVNNGVAKGHRHVWDGVSWATPYAPFCKLRCALDYGRKDYERGRLGVK